MTMFLITQKVTVQSSSAVTFIESRFLVQVLEGLERVHLQHSGGREEILNTSPFCETRL